MKNKDKNKILMIAIGIVIVILIAVVIFLIVRNIDDTDNLINEDAAKFAQEYTLVDNDNVFVYADFEEIINVLESGSGIIYFGFPECKWCQNYVSYLNEVAKEKNVSEIYYYNIREDRADNTENYLRIVDYIREYLEVDEDGNPRIYVPAVVFVNGGTIVGFDDETSLDTGDVENPREYWTKEKEDALKERLDLYIDNTSVCLDCNS